MMTNQHLCDKTFMLINQHERGTFDDPKVCVFYDLYQRNPSGNPKDKKSRNGRIWPEK